MINCMLCVVYHNKKHIFEVIREKHDQDKYLWDYNCVYKFNCKVEGFDKSNKRLM